jgi:chemotaxis protein methyltransferase CheR
MSDTVLDHLSSWTERTLGIKAGEEALEKLRVYLEKNLGSSIFTLSGTLEWFLSSPEERFNIARFLTNNETYFFREGPHFDLLLRELLPRFAREKRTIRICSAATSIGCEAYSLAMLMDYYGRTVEKLDFQIEAFDVSREVIEIAKRGRYSENALRDDGNRWNYILDRYLRPEGDEYVVDHSLKERIHFFTHNIMDGMEPLSFDLILFRNALIYFAPEGRRRILDFLVKALFDGGVLLFGISETPSVNHPFLQNKHALDTFYFQKTPVATDMEGVDILTEIPWEPRRASSRRIARRRIADRKDCVAYRRITDRIPGISDRRSQSGDRRAESLPQVSAAAFFQPASAFPSLLLPVRPADETPAADAGYTKNAGHTRDAKNISSLLEQGETLAKRVLDAVKRGKAAPLEDELIAAVIYLLSLEDFAGAERVLSFAEKKQASAFTKFLRGEYNYLSNETALAETYYKETAALDNAFWPGFYRMSLLAAEGNRTVYEYKIKKALESIDLGKELSYECFIGGFSPDYYRRILEKRLKG